MNPIIRNILAVIGGIVVGSVVNMVIIQISGSVIPPPDGVDMTTPEGLKESMHLFQPRHFIFPFLAHAIGTFVGAFLAAFIAVNHKIEFAIAVGIFFLMGGIASVVMLASPLWFTILDLALAYIPTSYIAGKLAARKNTVVKDNSYNSVA
jgi:hypothetical protein